MLVPATAQIQVDDSNVDYLRVQYYVVYASENQTKADKLVQDNALEESKFTYKEKRTPEKTEFTDTVKGQTQYTVSGFLTFLDDDDAMVYYSTIFPKIVAEDVMYARIYLLGNNHHAPDDLIHPDIVWLKTEYGDIDEILDT